MMLYFCRGIEERIRVLIDCVSSCWVLELDLFGQCDILLIQMGSIKVVLPFNARTGSDSFLKTHGIEFRMHNHLLLEHP